MTNQNGEAMTDNDFTKLLGDHLVNAKGFYDWGIQRGLTKPEDIRLTIEARRGTARALVDGGLSQREAAKVLGVSEGTVRNDLRNDFAESAQELRADENPIATKRKAGEDSRKAVGNGIRANAGFFCGVFRR
jgi:DNA invertase Pin-like site-specific DNA recombinase